MLPKARAIYAAAISFSYPLSSFRAHRFADIAKDTSALAAAGFLGHASVDCDGDQMRAQENECECQEVDGVHGQKSAQVDRANASDDRSQCGNESSREPVHGGSVTLGAGRVNVRGT